MCLELLFFLSLFPAFQQTLHTSGPTAETTHCSILQCVSTKLIPLTILGCVPQLAPQTFHAALQSPACQFLGDRSDLLCHGLCRRWLLLDRSDALSPPRRSCRIQVSGFGAHQFVEMILGEVVHKGDDRTAALDESPAKVHIGDVRELVVRDVQ